MKPTLKSHRAQAAFAAGLALIAMAARAHAQAPPTLIKRLPGELYLPAAESTETAIPIGKTPVQTRVKPVETLKDGSALKPALATPEALNAAVKKFVEDNARNFGLEQSAGALVQVDKRETMLGPYFEFRQSLEGIPILASQVSISLTTTGAIRSVVTNLVQVPKERVAGLNKAPSFTKDKATAVAWEDLGQGGELLESPSAEMVWVQELNALTLAYLVKLAVTKPFGYWEYQIDATTGRIISRVDRRIHEGKREEAPYVPAATTPTRTLAGAEASFKLRSAAAKATLQEPKAGQAPALIFDPDPITTLRDSTLGDGSAGAAFKNAYVPATLQEVTVANGLFHLRGPLVQIEDLEPGEGSGHIAPSTRPASGWTSNRGDNGFNDVMTYYHLHTSLSYLRKLGYSGARDRFPTGIAADSDGLDGDDNSHYVPNPTQGLDRLAFGHGCVDDNEDVDVILHELGHSIHHHLNPAWGGGDAGAIGEGFGDYWAASYSLRTKNGDVVDPAKVFTWDGIAACWAGRRLDRLTAQYTSTHSYRAHEGMGAFVSDELWSTPLFQSLLELKAKGQTTESVDQVILAAMENIGLGFTMRTLATNTVVTAEALFPAGPHAEVFKRNFQKVGILP